MTPMPDYLITMAMAHARSAQEDQTRSQVRRTSARGSLSARVRSWIALGRRPVSAAPQDLVVPMLRDYPYGC